MSGTPFSLETENMIDLSEIKSKNGEYDICKIKEALEERNELLQALKAVMATMQKKTPWDDAKIILTMAKRVIAKAETL